jgi:hypothetical protein
MTILVWLDRARGGSVHEVVGPSIGRPGTVQRLYNGLRKRRKKADSLYEGQHAGPSTY